MRTLFGVIALGVAACSQGTTSTPGDLSGQASVDQAGPRDLSLAVTGPDMAAAPLGATVVMKDDFYMPNMVTISAGQKVRWNWQAAGTHGVDFVDAALTDGPLQDANNLSFEYTFPTAGVYQVRCKVHGAAMPLTVTVQ